MPDGRTFVTRIVRTLREAGVTDLVIVTGRHHDAVVDTIAQQRFTITPRIVRNPDPSRGQLSSLLVGMDAVVTRSTEGVLMTLVDVPLIRVSTVTAVIAAWHDARAPIVRPAIGDRHGIPSSSIARCSTNCDARPSTPERSRSSARTKRRL